MRFWKGDKITSMTGDNIFVYGANPEFRNGAGAALQARKFGALPYGGGRGIVGNTYGLVTKNLKKDFFEKETGITYTEVGERGVSLKTISDNVLELYECATLNPDKVFLLHIMQILKILMATPQKRCGKFLLKIKKFLRTLGFITVFAYF